MTERLKFDKLNANQRAAILEDLVKHPFIVAATYGSDTTPLQAAHEVFEMVRLGRMQLALDKNGKLLTGANVQIAVCAYDINEIAPGVAAAIVHGDE